MALGVAPDRLLTVEGAGLDDVVFFNCTPLLSLVVIDAPCYDRDKLIRRSGGLFVEPQSCHSEKFSVGSLNRHLARKSVEQSEQDGLDRSDVLLIVDALLNGAHTANAANDDDPAANAVAVEVAVEERRNHYEIAVSIAGAPDFAPFLIGEAPQFAPLLFGFASEFVFALGVASKRLLVVEGAAITAAAKVVGGAELGRPSADSQNRHSAGSEVAAGMGDVGVDSGTAPHVVAEVIVLAR